MRRGVVFVPAVIAALALAMVEEIPSARAEAARGAGPLPLAVPPSIGAREPPRGWPGPPAVSAPSYLLIDAATGQALAAKDADVRRPVASTVKVLTALSVLRRTSLDDPVTVGDEVRGLPPDAAKVGVEPGETWTIGDLLEGLMARSGNDAALALAAGVGGTVEGFVGLMGSDAAALGLDGVPVHEPAGLGDRNRLSARDLADITRAAMADPRFVSLMAQRVVDLPGVGPVASRNRLLRTYPGAMGVKTGYTGVAGRCLIAAAEREGRRFLAVVLGSTLPEGHFTDARMLLDFAFTNFAPVPVAGQDSELELRVPGAWVSLDAPPTSLFAPATQPVLDRMVQPPVEADGDLATTVAVLWRGVEVGRLELSGRLSSPRMSPGGATAVGDWLMGRAYAAMRAATVAHVWAASSPDSVPPASAAVLDERVEGAPTQPAGEALARSYPRPPGGFAAFPARVVP